MNLKANKLISNTIQGTTVRRSERNSDYFLGSFCLSLVAFFTFDHFSISHKVNDDNLIKSSRFI